ncbi:HTH-type transcriptional repressor BdcR [Gammaproteobacteria bacterium]|nr:HTH-type transcriptional repressor BdcR [Gammaproteobacteria bacterium]
MSEKKVGKTAGEKRREAIMEAAWGLFLEKGFEAVSVDEIIKKSGGSKSTVYDLFGSKEGLFLELITSVNERILTDARMPETSGYSTREALTRLAWSITGQILTDRAIDMYRLSVSEAKRFPKIGKLFYEAGPGLTKRGVSGYIEKEAAAGRLKVKDPRRAAEFFLGMLLINDHLGMSVGALGVPSRARLKGIIEEAVDVVLAAYGTENGR